MNHALILTTLSVTSRRPEHKAILDDMNDRAMRREAFFSGDSPYDVMLRVNLLLHDEAATLVTRRLEALSRRRPDDHVIEILDLACGVPLTIVDAVENLPDRRFGYTGVDIHPDQVRKARELPMPGNVVASRIINGSAWDLTHLANPARRTQSMRRTRQPGTSDRHAQLKRAGHGALPTTYDFVFVGMNLHHGTPEEIWLLATQLRSLLAPDGCLTNHDCYRPEGVAYVRRPATTLEDGKRAPLHMVNPQVLAEAAPPSFHFEEAIEARPAWRADLIDRLLDGYLSAGGDEAGAEVTASHSWARDFPLSVTEMRTVLEAAGYGVEAHRFPEEASLVAPYAAFISAWPHRSAKAGYND